MKEWIEHYKSEGVEHFYLINNNSSDNYMDIINEYENIITLFNFKKKGQQCAAYNTCFMPHKNETKCKRS